MKFKYPLILMTPLIFASCGILELLFPVEFPQRYIDRDIQQSELVGTWNITPDSEARADDYFQQTDIERRELNAPWKSINFQEDGVCEVEIVENWAVNNTVLQEGDARATCTWNIDSILGYDEGGSIIDVPGVFIRFEHYNKSTDAYNVYYSELYVVDEDKELVLWNFIGDPIPTFLFQDFKKTSK